MKCACGHRLLDKVGAKVKLRTSILVFTDDGATCVMPCPACKREIQIPVMLDKQAIPVEPKLVVRSKQTEDPKRDGSSSLRRDPKPA